MGSLSILTVTLHILAWICTLQQTVVKAATNLHLTHYTHEIRGGPNATLLQAAGTPQPDLGVGAAWGSLDVYDNMLRAGPDMNSTLMGRVTGTATGIVKPTTTGDGTTRVQLVMHHVYESPSIYNGSYINVVGILFFPGPWEMVVPGCTGSLRGYSGYGICEQILQTTGPPPLYLAYRWDFYLTKA